MYDTTKSINNVFAISSFQKTIAAGCFYDYFDMSNMNHSVATHCATKRLWFSCLTMFGIYSAGMNVAGVKFSWGYCLFSVVAIYKRVLWL